MGIADAAVPIAFFAVSVFAIAQSSITVKTYLDTKKDKDASFYFSVGVLTISIIALIASAYMAYKGYKGGNATVVGDATTTPASAVAGSVTNTGGPATLTQALAARAANLSQTAAKAENAKEAVNNATAALSRAGVK
jgi:hypothetical protein